MEGGVAVEQVGQVKHLELARPERAEFRERRGEHLDGADLERLHLLLVLVEGAVGVDLDLDLAAGGFLGELLELEGGLALRRIGGHDVAELDDDDVGRGIGGGGEEGSGQGGGDD